LPLEPIAPPKVKFTLNDNIAAGAMRLSAIAARRLLTTATPIRDRVRNLWAQLDLAHPYEWGKYWDWAKRYTGAVEKTFGGMDDTGATNLDELKVRIDVSTHRVRHEEANAGLPPKRRTVVYLPAAIQVASGMTKEVRAAAKSGDPTALREVLLLEACARKRPWLLGQIEARVDDGQKVVIFTGRRKECDELLEKCRSKWPGALIVGGHGGHLAEERDATKDRYMAAPGPAILIGTTDAWGEGLNLQDSDALYQALLPATPGQIIQAEGRVSRLGQRRSVEIVYPVCEGTIDERLAGILLTKLPALERVVDQDEVRSFARELSGVDDKDLLAGLAAKILTRVKGDG
jgi:SNF2 family DNA or RNA helicase